jgi:hypothetical protein
MCNRRGVRLKQYVANMPEDDRSEPLRVADMQLLEGSFMDRV